MINSKRYKHVAFNRISDENFTFIESIWDIVTNILNIQNRKVTRNDDSLKINSAFMQNFAINFYNEIFCTRKRDRNYKNNFPRLLHCLI